MPDNKVVAVAFSAAMACRARTTRAGQSGRSSPNKTCVERITAGAPDSHRHTTLERYRYAFRRQCPKDFDLPVLNVDLNKPYRGSGTTLLTSGVVLSSA